MSKKPHVVARVSEVPPGARKRIEIGKRAIALFNLDGEFYAIGDTCPHESGSLCKGKLVGLAESDEPGVYKFSRPGEFVKCPWHGWEFDIRTGQSYCEPDATRVRSFEASIARGEEVVKGPYVAETFPVAVEDDYVIVTV
ncbi:MAG: Rieske 2Fe-2S domain-containing protein [Hyphomicrobiales bacterium]|nr:Rieske 2Fe-2S domain-containing protein [Hyphomicrobiales bacterium]